MKLLHGTLLSVVLGLSLTAAGQAAELTERDIRNYYQAWSDGDVDALMAYFAETIVYEDVATGDLARGRDEVRKFAATFLAETPGVKVTPTRVLVGKDGAAVEWTMGAGEGDDAWSVRGACMLEHANGRITRATDYWNTP